MNAKATKPKREAPKKTCPTCNAVVASAKRTCDCGYKWDFAPRGSKKAKPSANPRVQILADIASLRKELDGFDVKKRKLDELIQADKALENIYPDPTQPAE